MILAMIATLAIVAQDHTALRAEPRTSATELLALWQGDVVEIRGERAGYLKVYNYRRERGGYVRNESLRPVEFTEARAPELLAVMRFLRDSPGAEPLGISYGAAYLKAASPRALTAEPFDAIARMAERLAEEAMGTYHVANVAAHLEVVEQFGIHMHSFERNGHMQVCYDGELFRRVLAQAGASSEERANAVLGLTRPECIDPDLGPVQRAALDDERGALLERTKDEELSAVALNRIRTRRAAVWAAIAYGQARRQEAPESAAQRALAELLAVNTRELGEDHQGEYREAVLKVSASRWGAVMIQPQTGSLLLSATPGEPGQTCLTLERRLPHSPPLVRHCTYGIVWMASAQVIPPAAALVLAVQPLEGWRELWLFHEKAGAWTIDVLSPGADDPEAGYVEFAGFAPDLRRLLIVREVKVGGQIRRRFEELRWDDLAVVRQASTPELLRDFGRWQDAAWRRSTLALH